eukprot:5908415-Pleurochrysis_carterae.AAC.1
MNNLYKELQRRLLQYPPEYGAEPRINHGLHHMWHWRHNKYSNQSDMSDWVARRCSCTFPAALTAAMMPWIYSGYTHLGVQGLFVLSWCRGWNASGRKIGTGGS